MFKFALRILWHILVKFKWNIFYFSYLNSEMDVGHNIHLMHSILSWYYYMHNNAIFIMLIAESYIVHLIQIEDKNNVSNK